MPTAFRRDDLLRTSKAADNSPVPARRYGTLIPTATINANLAALWLDVLEPLAAGLGRGVLTSVYRCPVVNSLVGGAPNSAHTVGLAADWVPPGGKFSAAVHWLASAGLPLDRVIFEERGKSRWLHLQRRELDQLPGATLWFHSPGPGIYLGATADHLARSAA